MVQAGFSLPDGSLRAARQAEREYANKRWMFPGHCHQAGELAFQNTQFIIQQGLALESTLINFANAVAQGFRVHEGLARRFHSIFNASLAKYQAQLEGYKTKAVVFEP